MKHVSITFLVALFVTFHSLCSWAGEPDRGDAQPDSAADTADSENLIRVDVVVENVKVNQGAIYIQVYRGKDAFEKRDGLVSKIIDSDAETVEVSVQISVGEYSIALYQDINEDGELNENFIGMPTEPWGMSNNAKARFGPPKWEDVRFEVADEPVTQRIELK